METISQPLAQTKGLNKYEAGMMAAFDVKLRGRLGRGQKDIKELKILNRILRVTRDGLAYEADPRHVELLARALGLEASRSVATPGVKHCDDEELADGVPGHEDDIQKDLDDFISSLLL